MRIEDRYMYKENEESLPDIDKRELRRLAFSATINGLLIGLVFIIIFFLFILFCVHIWL